MKSVGRHLVMELWGCENLNSPEIVERALLDIVEALNLTLLSLNVHPFSPIGVTGVAIVSESHVVIHTWPELGYAAVDVFTCGDTDPATVLAYLREEIDLGEVSVRAVPRFVTDGRRDHRIETDEPKLAASA